MHYKIIEKNYQLFDEENSVGPSLERVAVCFESPSTNEGLAWTLHKHGDPARVHAWCDQARRAFSASAIGQTMAKEMHVIEGKLNLDDLNAALSTNGAVEKMVKNALALVDKKNVAGSSVKIDGQPIEDSIFLVNVQRKIDDDVTDVVPKIRFRP